MRPDLRTLLAGGDFGRVLDEVGRNPRTLGTLITLTYSDDPLICWRSIDAIGRCADHLSPARPAIFRKYLQRLFWMMSDESGSVAPHAPEAIGEIIQSNPQEYSDFIPLTLSLLKLEPEDLPLFLPAILYALGRIGAVVPERVKDTLNEIETLLSSPDIQTRAMAVRCLDRIGCSEILLRHPRLKDDSEEALIYHEERIQKAAVSQLYADALSRSHS